MFSAIKCIAIIFKGIDFNCFLSLILIIIQLNVNHCQQTTTPTLQNGQCPCIVKPGTNQCMKYDSRFQATSLDEAMTFFDDLTLLGEHKPPEQEATPQDVDCTTKQCKVCKKLLQAKLNAVGLFRDPSSSEANTPALETCHKYRFARKNSDAVDYHEHMKRKHPGKKSDQSSENEEVEKRTKNPKHQQSNRPKRDTVNTATEVVGIRYNLSCTPKGSAVDGPSSSTNLISLCSKCWAWRQLPANYFPQFVNELVCHNGDVDCLSGYATCGAGTHVVEVIRNDTNKLTAMTLTAGSYCECQVHANSALQGLVMGTTPNLTLKTITDG